MRMHVAVTVILISALAASVGAAPLTLAEAIAEARAHSFHLRKAEAEHRAATADLLAAEKNRFPTLSAEAMANYQSEIADLQLTFPGAPGIRRELGSKEQYQFSALVSLPVYTGGRISGGIDRAASLATYQAAIRDATTDQVILSTRLAYFSLLRARRELAAAEAGKRRAEIVRDDVTAMFEGGVADSVDLLEVAYTVNRANLRVREAEIELRQASIELAILLGRDPSEAITPSDEPAPPARVASLLVQVDTSKPELRAANAMLGVQRATVGLSKSGYLPSLSVTGGYHYGKPNIDLFENTWNDHFTVGARLTWSFNLGNKTASEVNAAQRRFDATRHERDHTAERLDEQARLAREQLSLARERYTIAEREVALTRDNYRLSQQRHRDGALSTNRLLEIETSLSEAEANLAMALAGFYQAQSAYWFAIGSEQLNEGM